jgi:[protein-PII] uridylyltransferase
MLARLDLPRESRETVEFLIRNHLRMSIVAFRRDTEDPEVVKQLAELVGTEERLKMLCLLTLADVAAVSPETMTPWREELLWQLYIDTYNALTLGYADDLIEQNVPALEGLLANRPADLSDEEIRRFLAGLPRRYLQLFSEGAIYHHVRLSRDIHPEEVHVSLDRRDSVWELTVVTLDKAFLFSNLCGLLSSYGMDILRGHALTNPNGLVLDVFRFADQDQFFALNPDSREQFLRELEDVVRGRTDVTARLRARERGVLRRVVPRSAPTVYADSHSSARYTIVDIIATNTLGLLHRVSRLMSSHGCEVDLVLISTEGQKAIDVFHITKGGAKLAEEAQQALTADLQRLLEGHDEAD